MHNFNTELKGQARINYIDALRGLSMILVVLAHVFLFMSPRHWDGSPVASVLMSFRMPLFFFVSGFFAYKAIDRWTRSVVADIVTRKVRAQILCATIFYMLYQLVNNASPFDFLHLGYGYFWFTIALFQMFMAYVALNLLSRLCRCNLVDGGLAVIILLSAFFGLTKVHGIGITLSWHQLIIYAQFFCMGILSRRHWHRFERILEADWFVTLMIICFVGGCFYFYNGVYSQPKTLGHYLAQGVLHRYSGLFAVLAFFHKRADYFDGDNRVARFLRFTGRRTLDVYMMHMFFMPHLFVTGWFTSLNPANMVVFKLAVAVPVALAITCLCLLCSNLLRTSHFLAVWLFGVRRRAPLPKKTAA